jgi:hypothetical protein
LLGRGLGEQCGAADIEQVTSAGDAQPLVVADQPIGNKGQAERSDEPEKRIRRRGAEPGDQARQLALEDRPADAHDADRADWDGNHNADRDALQQEY